MKYAKLFFYAALTAGAALITSCKDDTEPGTEPSDVQGLFVNEVCSGGTDWIEFYNATGAEIDLSGYHVQDNKGTDEEYTFPAGSKIDSKGFLVIEEGTFEFGISGDGDAIAILDEAYAKIDEVIIPAMEDGFTYSRIEDGGSSWEIVEGGTKGRSNSGTPDDNPADNPDDNPETSSGYEAIRLNELNGNDPKYIELYNFSDKEIDLTDVQLKKDDDKIVYIAPEGTTLAAHGYLVLYADAANYEEGFTSGLSAKKAVKIELLSPKGELIDVFKNLTIDGTEEWGEDPQYNGDDAGQAYGRQPDGTGKWYLIDSTEGSSNDEAAKGEEISW